MRTRAACETLEAAGLHLELIEGELIGKMGERQPHAVLDVSGRRLIVHRGPQGGQYSSVVEFGEQESVAPLAAPGSQFRVADAFPA